LKYSETSNFDQGFIYFCGFPPLPLKKGGFVSAKLSQQPEFSQGFVPPKLSLSINVIFFMGSWGSWGDQWEFKESQQH
jgi:hypothetical protein